MSTFLKFNLMSKRPIIANVLLILGFLLWIPSFILALAAWGGWISLTLTQEIILCVTFILSLIIINFFKPDWAKDQ